MKKNLKILLTISILAFLTIGCIAYVTQVHQVISKPETISNNFVRAVQQTLSQQLAQRVRIARITQLSTPEKRNRLLRITLSNPPSGVSAYVLCKHMQPELYGDWQEARERLAHEAASLAYLNTFSQATQWCPAYYGMDTEHLFVLLEDLSEDFNAQHGAHTNTLVDVMLSGTGQAATHALVQFGKKLGSLHATTYKHTEKYNDFLLRAGLEQQSWHEEFAEILSDTQSKVEWILHVLQIPYTPQLQEEIRHVLTTVLEPSDFTTFIQGDVGFDNVLYNAKTDELRFIDFEWGSIGCALLDLTCLRMCMPTSWCAKKIPESVLNQIEIPYRNTLAKQVAAARNDQLYYNVYTCTCAYWMLQYGIALISRVLEKDKSWPAGHIPPGAHWCEHDDYVRPRIITRLQIFCDIAEKYALLPALRTMTTAALNELHRRWPDVTTLDVYPALREQKICCH